MDEIVIFDLLQGIPRVYYPPEPPRVIFDGLVDHGTERWRFSNGQLVRWLRYGPHGPIEMWQCGEWTIGRMPVFLKAEHA